MEARIAQRSGSVGNGTAEVLTLFLSRLVVFAGCRAVRQAQIRPSRDVHLEKRVEVVQYWDPVHQVTLSENPREWREHVREL